MHKAGKILAGAIRHCLAGALDLVLPDVCAACGGAVVVADGLCEGCNLNLLALAAMHSCPRCGTTLGPNIPARADGCQGCPSILPRFRQVFRLGPYTGCLRMAVRNLKYHRCQRLRGRLGRLLGQAVAAGLLDGRPDLVVPVPTHWLRRIERGFDHSRSIATRVAREIQVPLGDELVRIRNTPPQVRLPRSQREQNVRGAFAVRRASAVRGAHILLVDDVTTTGATANEAARTLLDAGALVVSLAVLAKAEPPTAYSAYLSPSGGGG